jgi:type IV secretory pathway VirB10-like protein
LDEVLEVGTPFFNDVETRLRDLLPKIEEQWNEILPKVESTVSKLDEIFPKIEEKLKETFGPAVPEVNKQNPINRSTGVQIPITKEEPKPASPQQERKKEEKPLPATPEIKKEDSKPSTPQPEKKESAFEAKLRQLEEMGFMNREANVELLVKRKGDMVLVVRDLLE